MVEVVQRHRHFINGRGCAADSNRRGIWRRCRASRITGTGGRNGDGSGIGKSLIVGNGGAKLEVVGQIAEIERAILEVDRRCNSVATISA